MRSIPYLWDGSSSGLPSAWKRQLDSARRVLAASDFDGTLSEIAARPETARAVPGAQAALAALGRRLGWEVAIVSGRALSDLRARCPVPGAWYIGSHGNQLAAPPGRRFKLPAPARFSAAARAELRKMARRWPGVVVEAKPVSVALHFRQAPQLESEILRAGRALARRYGYHPLLGKCMLELIVPGARNKGETIALLARQLAADAVIYFGDDRTDETVFALRTVPLLGVYVAPGKPEKTTTAFPETIASKSTKRERRPWPTRAHYWLAGPAEVVQTLQSLALKDSKNHRQAGSRPVKRKS